MLNRLAIRDFVIVDQLDLEFSSGFSALTGETGAGKSILLDALGLVLGGRAEPDMIRTGSTRAEVVAEFDVAPESALHAWLEEAGLSVPEGGILLRRVIEANGRSKAWVNGTPVTQAQMRAAAEGLADIHGQHAHHALMRAEAQRQLLDTQAPGLVLAVQCCYREWLDAKRALERAEADATGLAHEQQMLSWQVEELEALAFSASEWDELEQEQARLAHGAGLLEGCSQAIEALEGGRGGICTELASLSERFNHLSAIDTQLQETASLLTEASIQADEARHALKRYHDRLELDPARLEAVDQRMGAITNLARKHRVKPVDLPGLLIKMRERLLELNQSIDPALLIERVQKTLEAYQQAAKALSAYRHSMAEEMSRSITEAMQGLALAGGQFKVALLKREAPAAHGQEDVEFQVSANPGQPLRALAKVASGGELSRIGLAIQVMTSQYGAAPTLIFDEVDVGIGGGVAQIVGQRLRELGQHRQVLCVTHLAQVASQAHQQWRIAKKSVEGQTLSAVERLEGEGRVEEIARMLGGLELTQTTRQHAAEMLAAAGNS